MFARVSPDQKSRIIKVARRTGVDVAFLGDGVNDAVALHAADVGISVESATDVAKDAADIVLLDKDLGVLADGVMEGRRIFANTLKYVLMATSSNFGNMFSAAGASLFLSFLPMLPSQILLNNLLYDVGQLAIPTDRVDPEVLARPAAWDIGFVRRFMSVFGPVSSIFDFLTFFVMLRVLHASHSRVPQRLVRRVPRHPDPGGVRHPHPAGPVLPQPPQPPDDRSRPVACALIGAVLPFTPLAGFLGFATLPVSFFLILLGMIATYLLLVEIVKRRFYAVQAHPRRPPANPAGTTPAAHPTARRPLHPPPPHPRPPDRTTSSRPAPRTRIPPATASTVMNATAYTSRPLTSRSSILIAAAMVPGAWPVASATTLIPVAILPRVWSRSTPKITRR